MEKENIEKIMKEYKDTIYKLDGGLINAEDIQNVKNALQIEKDKKSVMENLLIVNQKQLHIEKLQNELNSVDKDREESLYRLYNKNIDEAKREVKNYIKESGIDEKLNEDEIKAYLENITKVSSELEEKEKFIKFLEKHVQKNEKQMQEFNNYKEDPKNEWEKGNSDKKTNIKNRKIEAISAAKRNLSIKQREIEEKIKKSEEEIKVSEQEIDSELKKLYEDRWSFKYKFDDKHEIINLNELKEIDKKINDLNNKKIGKTTSIKNKMKDLNEAKKLCEKYLTDIDKEFKPINDVLNGKYNELKTESKKVEPTKPEPAKTEPTKTEPTKTEPTKTEPAKTEPAKAEPAKTEPAKAEPAKTESTKTESTKTESAKAELAKTEPTKTEPTKAESTTGKQKINQINIDAKKGMYINNQKNKAGIIFYGDRSELIKNADIKSIFKNEEECKKFEKADPNIIRALKDDKEKLEMYANVLNGNISKEDFSEILNIVYNIKGIGQSDLGKEEKKAMENYAYEHRNIAEIKSNIFQKIKFAFRGFKERVEKNRKTKMLTAGIKTAPIKDEDEGKNIKENNINSMEKYVLSNEEKAKLNEKAYEWLDKDNDIKNNPEYQKMVNAGSKEER